MSQLFPTICSWKIQVRKVLSADKIFQHTGMKQKHETVWKLHRVRRRPRQTAAAFLTCWLS
jgi:hypothetical protein